MSWRYVRLWAELLGVSWRLYPGQTAAALAVKAASATVVTVTALALRAAVDGVIQGDPEAAVAGAAAAALAFAVGIYLGGIDAVLHMLLVERVGLLHLHRQIHADIAGLEGLDHLERTDFLDRVTVVRGAAWNLMFGMWTAVDAVFNAVKLALLLTLLGMVSPWLLVLLVFAAAPIWFDQRGQRLVTNAETDTAEAMRLQRHLFNLATEAAGGKEIRVSGSGEELARRQADAWNEVTRGWFRARVGAAAWKLAGWSLFTTGFAAGLWLVVYRAANGTGTVGDIVLAVTVAVSLRDSIQDTVFGANEAMRGARVIEPYLWLRDYVAAHRDRPAGARPCPDTLREGVTFERVTFGYPGTERRALDEVSCHLPAGSVIAVVGEYGSGKSTLVKLLCKFYQPDSGAILVDGTRLSELDTEGWRARSSAAFQDFGRFKIRFAETVGVGDLPHLGHSGRVLAAVRAADAEPLVERLPDGLDTQLGRVFEGVELSEGQWQKTALARASMRTEPLLFVLDEPTASLDAHSEHAIFERYMARARELAARTGAITVIVSHRFSTVTDADLILVLDKGRLVESGSHAELMARGGRYAELYGIQATAYSPTGA
ncbi:ABC transporter ATP-binding protein [Phytohabitans kaempferiae]|uniref:ABC transporter ATP-binding protein n=1 Tax=Phytohabitans kaempferiae TaxID=1620943 RepID=A0ABV6MAM9_9ACTN